jgi:hypothetical protein
MMTERSGPEIELLVLMSATRLGPDLADAVSILEDIRRETGRPVRRAEVDSTLRFLEGEGFVSIRIEQAPVGRSGAPLPLVTVERGGSNLVRAAAEAIRARIDDLVLGEDEDGRRFH